jgi:hypothetical protein
LISDRNTETINSSDWVHILANNGIVVLKADEGVTGIMSRTIRDDTRERAPKHTHVGLSREYIGSPVVEDGVQLFNRNVAMFGDNVGVNVSGEESSLNNILERLLKVASKSVGAVLTNGIHSYGVIFIVKIWNSLGRSNQSHL